MKTWDSLGVAPPLGLGKPRSVLAQTGRWVHHSEGKADADLQREDRTSPGLGAGNKSLLPLSRWGRGQAGQRSLAGLGQGGREKAAAAQATGGALLGGRVPSPLCFAPAAVDLPPSLYINQSPSERGGAERNLLQ